MVEAGFGGDELSIDWDNLLETIPHDPSFDFVDLPNLGNSPSNDVVEPYLLGDGSNYAENENQIVIEDGFSPDMLLDLYPRSKNSTASPQPAVVGTDREASENPTSPEIRADDAPRNDVVDAADDDYANPNAKKRKRQMRNRDAAVRSRERKKMYVRDLEAKSKYYEAECKRLGILLQCCLAENQALRLSVHNPWAHDGSTTTKQESAVLLLESLLLGSLLGILAILIGHLAILPWRFQFLLPALEMILPENRAGKRSSSSSSLQAPIKAGNSKLRPLMMGKKYRASRSRMKKKMFEGEIHV